MPQIALLLVTCCLFAGAFVLGLRNMRRATAAAAPSGLRGIAATNAGLPMGRASRVFMASATLLDAALLLWRAITENKLTLPLSNHFDAFLLLALLLAIILMYFRWTQHLRALAFFLLPMIIVFLLLGAVLSITKPQGYAYGSIWIRLHVVTIIAGTLCFALGCVGGAVYLLAHRQLKHKGLDATHRWIGLPPLASIEKFNQWMVYLGFPLLTVAMITGILIVIQEPDILHRTPLMWKISLAVLAWLVYAVLAHLPLAPRFRGPRAAWLWIVGFALFLSGFVAATWIRT